MSSQLRSKPSLVSTHQGHINVASDVLGRARHSSAPSGLSKSSAALIGVHILAAQLDSTGRLVSQLESDSRPQLATAPNMETAQSLYDVLAVPRTANAAEIRRSFRTLATQLHPDKAGNSDASREAYRQLQHAYDVLGDAKKRKLYDNTGTWQRGADEEFVEAFAGGSFRDRGRGSAGNASEPTPLDQLIVVKQASAGEKPSHTAGFEAWLRSRGTESGAIFTADDAAAAYGVTRSSYDPVPIAYTEPVQLVRCLGSGRTREVLSLHSEALPAALEWGQVLVEWLYAPINPADLYSARLGGIYGSDTISTPYVAGHDGVGIVAKVGPGIKDTQVGDLVLPAHSFVGTWRTASVVRETDVLRLPASTKELLAQLRPGQEDGRPAGASETAPAAAVPPGVEVLALAREAAVAYLLLERYGSLKPGDCILINAPTSTVGQALLQLARLLKLRAVAVVRPPPAGAAYPTSSVTPGQERPSQDVPVQRPGTPPRGSAPESRGSAGSGEDGTWRRLESWLKGLGATVVIRDEGSIRAELERFKFFARPRLALDAVGGRSAVRLAEALVDGGELVTYGCLGGQSAAWPWQQWVFRELRVGGFNLRRWMATGGTHTHNTAGLTSGAVAAAACKRLVPVLEALLKLVAAGLLTLNYTQYDLSEFGEALDHAEAPGRTTKVLLRMQNTLSTSALA